MFIDYYKLLDLKTDCTQADIKKAFRNKIKIYHPDITKSNDIEYHNNAQLLIKAYSLLSDSSLREQYDAKLELFNSKNKDNSFNYREFLLKQNNLKSYAKLIMYELYCNNDDYALDVYFKYPDSIIKYLDKNDMLDCLFMLCEECVRQEKFLQANDIILKIILYEVKKPYFKSFFEFILDLFRLTVDNIIIKYDFQTAFSYLEFLLKNKIIHENLISNLKQYTLERIIRLCKNNNQYEKLELFTYII